MKMNFWDTEEAGFFIDAILTKEDIVGDIIIDKTYKNSFFPRDKAFRKFQSVQLSSEQRFLYLEAKIPSLSQGDK